MRLPVFPPAAAALHLLCDPRARMTAADAVVTEAGCASGGARSAARITAVLSATWRR